MYIKRHQISSNINIQCINQVPPKGCSRRTIHRHKANQTLHAKGRHGHGLGAGQGTLTRGSGPTRAPGKGWRGKHDPTHATFLLTTEGVGARSALGSDPESPIISRHVLCWGG